MKRVVVGFAVVVQAGQVSAFIVDDDTPMFSTQVKRAEAVVAQSMPAKQHEIGVSQRIKEPEVVVTQRMKEPVKPVPRAAPQPQGPISAAGARALELMKHAKAAGIRGVELAQLMAQAAHESAGFRRMSEVGDTKYFRKYDPAHNPRKAEKLGNIYAGDGARFRGRGFLQLTGRDNYRKAGHSLGLPLEQYPDLVERPDIAAKTSIWYWKTRVQPDVDNWRDTHAVTREVNGGLNGIHERVSMFQKFRNIFSK